MISYPNSLQNLEKDFLNAKDSFPTKLAQNLVQSAKLFDLSHALNLNINLEDRPLSYTSESVFGAPWADDEKHPLESGEKWNHGRRATNTGLKYTFNPFGLAVNPYIDTGVNGRGGLGRYGPNHTVDNGILTIKKNENGDPELYALCILRKLDGDVPAFAGGFAEYGRYEDGSYHFNKAAETWTRTKEFFEEMISGSISLLPEYQPLLDGAIEKELNTRTQARGGRKISESQTNEISEQVETALKLKQIEEHDPYFLKRLHEVTASGKECFAGPILQSQRSTNNAWIETQLSWIMMDENIWSYIKGENPVFDYDFSAGDDASGVKLFKIDPWLISNAHGSHGALLAFMSASYLLSMQAQNKEIPVSVIEQLKDLTSFLVSSRPSSSNIKEQLKQIYS